MALDPVIGHPTCDLDLQRRIRETRRDRMAKAIRSHRARRPVLDRLLRRHRAATTAPAELDPHATVDHGDDVWKSLRF